MNSTELLENISARDSLPALTISVMDLSFPLLSTVSHDQHQHTLFRALIRLPADHKSKDGRAIFECQAAPLDARGCLLWRATLTMTEDEAVLSPEGCLLFDLEILSVALTAPEVSCGVNRVSVPLRRLVHHHALVYAAPTLGGCTGTVTVRTSIHREYASRISKLYPGSFSPSQLATPFAEASQSPSPSTVRSPSPTSKPKKGLLKSILARITSRSSIKPSTRKRGAAVKLGRRGSPVTALTVPSPAPRSHYGTIVSTLNEVEDQIGLSAHLAVLSPSLITDFVANPMPRDLFTCGVSTLLHPMVSLNHLITNVIPISCGSQALSFTVSTTRPHNILAQPSQFSLQPGESTYVYIMWYSRVYNEPVNLPKVPKILVAAEFATSRTRGNSTVIASPTSSVGATVPQVERESVTLPLLFPAFSADFSHIGTKQTYCYFMDTRCFSNLHFTSAQFGEIAAHLPCLSLSLSLNYEPPAIGDFNKDFEPDRCPTPMMESAAPGALDRGMWSAQSLCIEVVSLEGLPWAYPTSHSTYRVRCCPEYLPDVVDAVTGGDGTTLAAFTALPSRFTPCFATSNLASAAPSAKLSKWNDSKVPSSTVTWAQQLYVPFPFLGKNVAVVHPSLQSTCGPSDSGLSSVASTHGIALPNHLNVRLLQCASRATANDDMRPDLQQVIEIASGMLPMEDVFQEMESSQSSFVNRSVMLNLNNMFILHNLVPMVELQLNFSLLQKGVASGSLRSSQAPSVHSEEVRLALDPTHLDVTREDMPDGLVSPLQSMQLSNQQFTATYDHVVPHAIHPDADSSIGGPHPIFPSEGESFHLPVEVEGEVSNDDDGADLSKFKEDIDSIMERLRQMPPTRSRKEVIMTSRRSLPMTPSKVSSRISPSGMNSPSLESPTVPRRPPKAAPPQHKPSPSVSKERLGSALQKEDSVDEFTLNPAGTGDTVAGVAPPTVPPTVVEETPKRPLSRSKARLLAPPPPPTFAAIFSADVSNDADGERAAYVRKFAS